METLLISIEWIAGIVFALCLFWKFAEFRYRRDLERLQKMADRGAYGGFCLHDPDTGNIYRVARPPRK